jgi:site-specific DNA-methyltransferase (adenine-specific)
MIAWLKKAVNERENGVTTVALIPARTNTGWWHDIVLPNAEVRFVRGRPRFGDADHGLPFPLAILVFRGGGGEETLFANSRASTQNHVIPEE